MSLPCFCSLVPRPTLCLLFGLHTSPLHKTLDAVDKSTPNSLAVHPSPPQEHSLPLSLPPAATLKPVQRSPYEMPVVPKEKVTLGKRKGEREN